MRKAKTVVFLILLLTSFPVLAQEVWTLEKCITHALENNLQIRQQELMVHSSKISVTQSRLSLLPTASANASHNYLFGRTVDPYTNEFTTTTVQTNNFSLGGSVTLFSGFQQYNELEKANLDLMASIKDLETLKNNISLNIASAYLQILYSVENYEIAVNQRDVTQKQVERTTKLVNAGSLAKSNLLDIQSQWANEELAVINAQNQLNIAYLTLIQYLDLKQTEGFEIDRPKFDDFTPAELALTVDMIYLEAQEMPQIKSADYKLQSSHKSLAMARGMRSPRLTASGGWGTGYSNARKQYEFGGFEEVATGYLEGNIAQRVLSSMPVTNAVNYPFADQLNDNSNMSLGFTLSIPIFSGWQVQSNVSNSKLNVQNYEYQLEIAKNQLYKDIQQAYNNAKSAIAEYNGSKKAFEATQESFKYTEQKFDVGLVNSVDYNISKNNLSRSQSTLIRAKYQYLFMVNVLNFYRGQPITLK